MSVVLSNEEVGPCRRALKIEVPLPAVEAESQRVVGSIRKSAQLPGFRKGKVPESLVRKRFKEEVEGEILERLVPRYWEQAQDEAGIVPLLPPEIAEVHFHADEPLTFVATVDIKPEIELRNLEDFDLPEAETETKPAEVDEAINQVRRQRGTWNPVEREAARGDRVSLTITDLSAAAAFDEADTEEGDEAETESAEAKAAGPRDVEIEVGDASVWEELSLAVTGLAAGRKTKFTRRQGEGDGEGNGEGDKATEREFEVQLEAVKELEMPPLDDDFAQGVGDFADVAALRATVEEQLADAKRKESVRQRESALLRQLAERHPFPVPGGVVDHEVKHMLEDYAMNLARRGVDPEKAELDWQKMADEARPQAEGQVRIRLLLDTIAQEREVVITEDQFERTIASLARMQGSSAPKVRRSLDEAGKLNGLRAQLKREAVVRQLLGEDPVEEVADGESAAAEESA